MHEAAVVPAYHHAGDAALDLVSVEDLTLAPGERRAVGTGWAMEFPPQYVGRILGRSGLALKSGIQPLGGVIDSNYRGEWKAILVNLSDQPFEIHTGDRIAQAVFYPIAHAELIEAEELADSDRGAGGFGSSGK